MIRVLVVEDTATARALLVEILTADAEIQVVGEARDGIEGVELTKRLRPDLVLMDIHMPRMDGLAATKEIMITTPTPIVLVTGSTKAREVQTSLETLASARWRCWSSRRGPDAGLRGRGAAPDRDGQGDVAGQGRAPLADGRGAGPGRVAGHGPAPEPPAPAPLAGGRGRGRIVAIATLPAARRRWSAS
jgi:two-component system chemotaxis response regulator CheB